MNTTGARSGFSDSEESQRLHWKCSPTSSTPSFSQSPHSDLSLEKRIESYAEEFNGYETYGSLPPVSASSNSMLPLIKSPLQTLYSAPNSTSPHPSPLSSPLRHDPRPRKPQNLLPGHYWILRGAQWVQLPRWESESSSQPLHQHHIPSPIKHPSTRVLEINKQSSEAQRKRRKPNNPISNPEDD